jgi:hydroxymethylbilane synthase
MTAQRLRLATRGSPLALAQAHHVEGELARLSDGRISCEIVSFTTKGDQLTHQRLTEAGGKGLFTRELDRAIDDGDADIAVHSLKDVPSILPEGQEFVCFPPREDAREAFMSFKAADPADLPEGARVGTASLRRQAQLLNLRPDLEVVTFRGNVQTRLRKLKDGEADATFLALAGLNRLDMADAAAGILDADRFLPAPGQGIVAVTARIGALDEGVREALAAMNDAAAERAAHAERGFLLEMDGSCRTPLAAHLFLEAGAVRLVGEYLSEDGEARFRAEDSLPGRPDHAALTALGREVGRRVRAQME